MTEEQDRNQSEPVPVRRTIKKWEKKRVKEDGTVVDWEEKKVDLTSVEPPTIDEVPPPGCPRKLLKSKPPANIGSHAARTADKYD